MAEWTFAAIGVALLAAFIWWQRRWQRHQISLERIPRVRTETNVRVLNVGLIETVWDRLLPWVLAITAGLLFWFVTDLGLFFCVSVAVLFFVLGHLIKATIVSSRALKLEIQLAQAIDQMVTSLHAGVGVLDALISAEQTARRPLKPNLSTLVSRIQLGDDAVEVCKDLATLIPLESFRLFFYALAVQWEGGGNLAPTLATTGRFIRDRVEVGRRVRAHTTEARFSVIAILFLTYFLAGLMWHLSPERLEGFMDTALGQAAAGSAIVLQALGAAWISRMAKIRF